jgi:hypothetical protein
MAILIAVSKSTLHGNCTAPKYWPVTLRFDRDNAAQSKHKPAQFWNCSQSYLFIDRILR